MNTKPYTPEQRAADIIIAKAITIIAAPHCQ